MQRIRPLEFSLIQFIVYISLWLIDEFTATLISLSFAVITAIILIISFIVEWIEPSKVPRQYFILMFISVLIPIITAIIYLSFIGGDMDWLKK